MKLILKVILGGCIAAGFATAAMAVPPGMELKFKNSPMGEVTFSGTKHMQKGKICTDCHTKIFQMKHGTAKIKFPDHLQKKNFCFACHNGETAFKADGNCQRCHVKAKK